jgi:hypothetical protein
MSMAYDLVTTKYTSRDLNPVTDGRQKCIVRPENIVYYSVHTASDDSMMVVPNSIKELRIAHFKQPASNPRVSRTRPFAVTLSPPKLLGISKRGHAHQHTRMTLAPGKRHRFAMQTQKNHMQGIRWMLVQISGPCQAWLRSWHA